MRMVETVPFNNATTDFFFLPRGQTDHSGIGRRLLTLLRLLPKGCLEQLQRQRRVRRSLAPDAKPGRRSASPRWEGHLRQHVQLDHFKRIVHDLPERGREGGRGEEQETMESGQVLLNGGTGSQSDARTAFLIDGFVRSFPNGRGERRCGTNATSSSLGRTKRDSLLYTSSGSSRYDLVRA